MIEEVLEKNTAQQLVSGMTSKFITTSPLPSESLSTARGTPSPGTKVGETKRSKTQQWRARDKKSLPTSNSKRRDSDGMTLYNLCQMFYRIIMALHGCTLLSSKLNLHVHSTIWYIIGSYIHNYEGQCNVSGKCGVLCELIQAPPSNYSVTKIKYIIKF